MNKLNCETISIIWPVLSELWRRVVLHLVQYRWYYILFVKNAQGFPLCIETVAAYFFSFFLSRVNNKAPSSLFSCPILITWQPTDSNVDGIEINIDTLFIVRSSAAKQIVALSWNWLKWIEITHETPAYSEINFHFLSYGENKHLRFTSNCIYFKVVL